jgi:hypothetical protein
LREILVGLVKEGAKDEMTGNFLSGRHKFFKIETFDYNKYYSNQRNGKFWNKWGDLMNEAAKVVFELSF